MKSQRRGETEELRACGERVVKRKNLKEILDLLSKGRGGRQKSALAPGGSTVRKEEASVMASGPIRGSLS